MRAIVFDTPGDESVLRIAEVDAPSLRVDQIRIRVRVTAVNRADLLQRRGMYPPPPGASTLLGLECAGEGIEVGRQVVGWSVGDRAMALLPGGGYAEQAVVHAESAMHVPSHFSDEEACAFPEVFLTAFLNVFMLAGAKEGERVLVHGGGSGVGTAAIALCREARVRVLVTVGSDEKARRCLGLGAEVAINYRREDFVERARDVDVILDHLGGPYLARNLEALGTGGRLVNIGTMGGREGTVDVGCSENARRSSDRLFARAATTRRPGSSEPFSTASAKRWGRGGFARSSIACFRSRTRRTRIGSSSRARTLGRSCCASRITVVAAKLCPH